MSALQRLRQKLVRPSSDTESRCDVTGEHTGTMNFTERTAWIDKIQRNGNRPRDWLELIKHMREATHYTNDQARQLSVSNLFADALKSVSTSDKKSEDYALLMIQFAQFRGQYSIDDAREMYQDVRYDAKKYAVSHVAAAQFELDCGNRNKAVKILEKGQTIGAKPAELIQIAFSNLVYGRSQLVTEEEERIVRAKLGDDKENLTQETGKMDVEKADSRRFSESSDDGTSGTHHAKQNSFKQPRPIARSTENQSDAETPSSVLMEQNKSYNSPSKKEPNYLLKVPTNEGKVEKVREPGKSLRSYHSTPDCKQSSVLSASSVTKSSTKKMTPLCRRNLGGSIGKPMRVPVQRTSLPQVMEHNSEMDESFNIAPLPELHSETIPDIHQQRERQGSDSGIVSNAGSTISNNFTSLTDHLDLREYDGIAPLADSSLLQPKQSNTLGNSTLRSQTLSTQNTLQNNVTNKTETEQPRQEVQQAMDHKPAIVLQEPRDNVVQNSSHLQSSLQNGKSQMSLDSGLGVSVQAPQPVDSRKPVAASKPMDGGAVTPAHVPPQPQLQAPMQPQLQAPMQPQPQAPMQPQLQAPMQPQLQAPMQALQGMQAPMVNQQSNVLWIKGKCYTVLGLMGRGGSSKVYTVFDTRQLLAVKCVDLSCADDSTIESYKNEIDLLQRLQYSNNVVKLYDSEYCEETNMLYLVMEKGDTDLSTFFKTRTKTGQLTPNTLSFYWEQMLDAVQVLHKEGIVHSDLKPANFLLVAGNLKLIDFGIAKAIGDMTSATRDQQVGTLNYMSPEAFLDTCGGTQLNEEGRVKPRIKIGVKSDVWSLGCILYNLVYGKTPFQHIGNQFVKLQAITNPNIPIEFPPHPNTQLVNVLKSCLQRDPKQRPSIEELLNMSLQVQRA